MSTPVAVTKFDSKQHNSPDEIRTPDKTKVEIVRLEGYTIGRYTMEPGWRWSNCIKPIVKTDKCQLSHVGYAVSGRITVSMQDGTQKTISQVNRIRYHLDTMLGLREMNHLSELK